MIDEIDKVPKYRSFNLYVILVGGILLCMSGLYMYIFMDPTKHVVFFDGGANSFYFMGRGLIMCIFLLYHFYKGNHRGDQYCLTVD